MDNRGEGWWPPVSASRARLLAQLGFRARGGSIDQTNGSKSPKDGNNNTTIINQTILSQSLMQGVKMHGTSPGSNCTAPSMPEPMAKCCKAVDWHAHRCPLVPPPIPRYFVYIQAPLVTPLALLVTPIPPWTCFIFVQFATVADGGIHARYGQGRATVDVHNHSYTLSCTSFVAMTGVVRSTRSMPVLHPDACGRWASFFFCPRCGSCTISLLSDVGL